MLVGGEPITRGLLGVSREGIDVKDKAWEGKGDCVGVLVGSAGLCFCPQPQLGVQLLGRSCFASGANQKRRLCVKASYTN